MTGRLITTFEEAKALRDAGMYWSINPHDPMYSLAVDQPSGASRMEPGYSSEHRIASEIYVRSYRLDELLAFLWSNIGYVDVHTETWGDVTETTVRMGARSRELIGLGKAPIEAAVSAVLNVLNDKAARAATNRDEG